MASINQLGVAADHVCRHPVMRQEVMKAYPSAKFNEAGHRIGEDETIALLKDCDAAIIGFEPINERTLSALPNLKIIGKYGNGCETIDFAAMKRHGVKFGYTWGVNKLAVAELTLGFMIMGLRYVMPLNLAMRAGERPRIRNGLFLTGRTVGIHGCGNIGKEVVRLLQPFNCNIIACDIKDYADFYKQWNVTPVSFDELLARSEVLTLHLPKTKQTIGLYSRCGAEKAAARRGAGQRLPRRHRRRGRAAGAARERRADGGLLRRVRDRAGAMRQAAPPSEHAGGAAYRRLDRGDAADHGAGRHPRPRHRPRGRAGGILRGVI